MFGYTREVQFKQIPQSEDCESLSHETEKSESPRLLSSSLASQLFTAILLLITLVIGAVLGAWLGSNRFIKANEFCIHEVSQDCRSSSRPHKFKSSHLAAPLLEDIDINFSTIRFNGSLLHENIFRKPASPEVDAAWQSLGVDCSYSFPPPTTLHI
jgi:hypothetical protein